MDQSASGPVKLDALADLWQYFREMNAKLTPTFHSLVLTVASLAVTQAFGIEADFKEDRFTNTQTIIASGPFGEDNQPTITTCLIVVQKLQEPRIAVKFFYRGRLQWTEGENLALWLIDGKRLSIPTTQDVIAGIKPFEHVHSAFMVLDAKTCSNILAAQSAEVRIGLLEIALTKEMLKPVQAVVDRYRAELVRGTLRERQSSDTKAKAKAK